jgi:hypothetical protein
MRRTLCRQSNAQFCWSDLEIRRAGQSGLEESSTFLARSPVMRRDEAEQITLGLIGHHLDQVGEVFSFRR